MALTVGKRRMPDLNPLPEGGSESFSGGKRWCNTSEEPEKSTIFIPDTPMAKLKASFPTVEDQALEQALLCCNKNLKTATVLLQRDKLAVPDQQMEDKKQDFPMSGNKHKRKSLIQLYLGKLEKVQTREEAFGLTELLLKRYKGELKSDTGEKMEMEGEPNHEKQNKVLKKGMQILTQRYGLLQSSLQKEHEKAQEIERKQKEVQNELNYYKAMAGSLANRLRELDYQSMSRTRFNPNPDVY